MARFQVTKTYTPVQGLSATFRQWRAKSHCRFIHGYALGVELTLECDEEDLDENGWVFNFGGLKQFKQYLTDTFDHKTLVAKDDPAIEIFRQMDKPWEARKIYTTRTEEIAQLIQLVEVERTGCEGFAKMIAEWLQANLDFEGRDVYLVSVKVFEHDGNSATYFPI